MKKRLDSRYLVLLGIGAVVGGVEVMLHGQLRQDRLSIRNLLPNLLPSNVLRNNEAISRNAYRLPFFCFGFSDQSQLEQEQGQDAHY